MAQLASSTVAYPINKWTPIFGQVVNCVSGLSCPLLAGLMRIWCLAIEGLVPSLLIEEVQVV